MQWYTEYLKLYIEIVFVLTFERSKTYKTKSSYFLYIKIFGSEIIHKLFAEDHQVQKKFQSFISFQ